MHKTNTVSQTTQTVAQLKSEGSTAFAKKEYAKALAAWDEALKSADLNDQAVIHANKAAVHVVNKRYKEAVTECTSALDAQPNYFKALIRRAKAFENLGHYKQALGDVQKANKLDQATEESRENERRLRDLVAGKRPAGVAGNGLAKRTSTPKAATTQGQRLTFPLKLTLDNDTRSTSVGPSITYSQLMSYATELFPDCGPFVLKYLDKEGDLVTVAGKNDIQVAMSQAVEAAQRSGGRQISQASLPAIRLQVVKVASDAEVPKPPAEETRQLQQLVEQFAKHQAAQKQQQAQAQAQAQEDVAQVPIDEWILSFVNLLKEHCGIDPDQPLEAMEVGNQKLSAAFKEMMEGDGDSSSKVESLLDEAQDKFHEQTAQGMVAQSNVHLYRAERLLLQSVKAGKDAKDVAGTVETHLKGAEDQIKAAIAYRPQLTDSYTAEASIWQMRAKLAANYIVETVKPREDIADPSERAAAEEEESKKLTRAAFARVTNDSAKAAEPLFEKALACIRRAIDSLPDEEKNRELKPLKPTAEVATVEDQASMKANILIQEGNMYYEHSFITAAVGGDWKSMVQKAKDIYVQAGAHPADIAGALKGHLLADEISDIISTVEPEETVEEEKQVKGIPALGPRPSGKKKSDN